MEKQTYEEAVLKSVMWWSDKMKLPLNQNNGDESIQGGMAFLLLNMVAQKAQESLSDSKIKMFEKKLIELLSKAGKYERTLSVDYDPCEFLNEACNYAEIDSKCLPIKSFTRIEDDNKVVAKYQYGGNIQIL